MISSLVCASLEADAAGLDYWTAQLRAGMTRGEVMVGFTPATIKSTNHQPPTEGDNS